MKLETLMLHGLFIACLAVCGLIFGAMLATSSIVPLAGNTGASVSTMLLAAPSSCALLADGVICPQANG